MFSSVDPEGEQEVRTPLENHNLYGFYKGNKQLDPPPPLEKVGPPPLSPGKCWTPSGTLKSDSFSLKLTI